MDLSRSDVWVAAAYAAFCLVSVCAACKECYRLARRHRHTSFRSATHRWYRAFKGWVARGKGALPHSHEGEEDPVERYVAMHVDLQASWEVSRLLAYGRIGLTVGAVLSITNILMGSSRWNSLAADLQTIVIFAIILLLLTFPRLLNPRSLSFWYSVFMILMVVKLWLDPTPIQLFYRTAINFAMRYVVSFLVRKVALAACWQAVYASLSSYRYTELLRDMQSDITVQQYVQFELVVVSLIVVSCHIEARSLRMKYRSEAMSSTMSGEQTAMWTMLELMCDVVIELDAKLQLKGKLERFSALVNLNRSSKPLQGMPLQEFMPLEEDKERLEGYLLGRGKEPATRGRKGEAPDTHDRKGEAPDTLDRPPDFQPGLFHAKLRDALGNHVRVEIFYTRFDRLGIPCFYAGIREHSDSSSISDLHTFGGPASTGSAGRGGRAKMGPQGTPAAASRCDLVPPEPPAGSESGSSSSSSSEGGRRRQGAAPIHRATRDTGMALSLIDTLELWVVDADAAGEACCLYHATVAATRGTLEHIAKLKCPSAFRTGDPLKFQCTHCGLLATSRRMCDYCGGKVLPFDMTLPQAEWPPPPDGNAAPSGQEAEP